MVKMSFDFIYFFLIWVLQPFQEYFTYIEPIIHQRWAKTGEPGGKTIWPSVSRTWLSHMWPELGSNHSGEKPNGLRVLSTRLRGPAEDVIWSFFFLFFSSGSHFVQPSRTIRAILVEDLQRNNPIMFDWNLPSSYRRCRLKYFLFLVLVAILCSGTELFEQFW